MNKKVDEEYKDIKDVYILQCICSELKDRIEKYRHLFKTTKTEELMQENERLHSIIKEVREKCDYLLSNNTVEINGRTYIKQEADNIVTNYIKEALDKEVN